MTRPTSGANLRRRGRTFDWRAVEARLNAYPQFMTTVDGLPIHFVQVRARDPDPLPLVLTHGWPSTFAELLPLVPLLTDPVAHGGQARDAFDVVIPSLPGFGVSARVSASRCPPGSRCSPERPSSSCRVSAPSAVTE